MDLQTELSLADGQCFGATGPAPDNNLSSKDDLLTSKSDEFEEEPKKDNEVSQEDAEKKKRKRNRNRKRKKQSQFQNSDELPTEAHSGNVVHHTGSFDGQLGVTSNRAVKENGSNSPPIEVVFDYTQHATEVEYHLMSLEQTLDDGIHLFPLESKESVLSNGVPVVSHPNHDALSIQQASPWLDIQKSAGDPQSNVDIFEIQEEVQLERRDSGTVSKGCLDTVDTHEELQSMSGTVSKGSLDTVDTQMNIHGSETDECVDNHEIEEDLLQLLHKCDMDRQIHLETFDYTQHALEVEAHFMSLEQTLDHELQLFPQESRESILSNGVLAVSHPNLDALGIQDASPWVDVHKSVGDPQSNVDILENNEEVQLEKRESGDISNVSFDTVHIQEELQSLESQESDMDHYPSADTLLHNYCDMDREIHFEAYDYTQHVLEVETHLTSLEQTLDHELELLPQGYEESVLSIGVPAVSHPNLDALGIQDGLPWLDIHKSAGDPQSNVDILQIQEEVQLAGRESGTVFKGNLYTVDTQEERQLPDESEIDHYPSADNREIEEGLQLLHKCDLDRQLHCETFDYTQHALEVEAHLMSLEQTLDHELQLFPQESKESGFSGAPTVPHPSLDSFEIHQEVEQDKPHSATDSNMSLDTSEIHQEVEEYKPHSDTDSNMSLDTSETEEAKFMDKDEHAPDPIASDEGLRKLLDRNRFEYEWPALANPVYVETSELGTEIGTQRKSRSLGRRITNGIRTVLPCMAPRKVGLGLRARDSLECLQPMDSGTEKHGTHGPKKKQINLPKNLKLFNQQ